MYIVIIQAKGALNCETQYIGPFASHIEAEDALCEMPVARQCKCKWIMPLQKEFDMMAFALTIR